MKEIPLKLIECKNDSNIFSSPYPLCTFVKIIEFNTAKVNGYCFSCIHQVVRLLVSKLMDSVMMAIIMLVVTLMGETVVDLM